MSGSENSGIAPAAQEAVTSKIDLVDGPKLLRQLKLAFKEGRKADLAVAFWGKGAATKLGLKEIAFGKSDVRIVCNLAHAGTNPEAIEELRSLGIEVRQHDTLHAKLGVVGEMQFVGSSNMSTNGLGDEGESLDGWEEANIVFRDKHTDIQARFDALWDLAKEINPDDIRLATERWDELKRRNALRKIQKKAKENQSWNLVDEILNPESPLHKIGIYVATHRSLEPSDEKTRRAALASLQKHQHGVPQAVYPHIDVYMNWPGIQKKATLIDFEKRKNGDLVYGGCWLRSEDFDDRRIEGNTYQIVISKGSGIVEGQVIGPKEQRVLERAVKRFWQNNPRRKKPVCLNTRELAKLIAEVEHD